MPNAFQLQLKLNPAQVFIRVILPAALLGLCVATVLLINAMFNQPDIYAERGELDLREWPAETGLVPLAGEWAFYWNEYVEAKSANDSLILNAPVYMSLPGVWNQIEHPSQQLTVLGQASLLLKLRLEAHTDYLLRIPTLTNRYRLWINDVLKVNDTLEQPLAIHNDTTKPRYISFNSNQGDVVILIHLLNDRHRAGGIWEPLELTKASYRSEIVPWGRYWDVFTAFMLSLAAIIIVYRAIKEQRWSYLNLALFAALMSLRAGTVNERVFFSLFSIQDWDLQQMLEHGSLYASIPFFALYLGYRFPSYFPPILHWVTAAVMGMLLLLVLITPPSVFSHTTSILKLVAIIYSFLWIGALVEHVRRQDKAALLLFVGSMLLILATVNDVLYTSNLINSTNTTHVGALAFLVAAFFFRGELVKQGALWERLSESVELHSDTSGTPHHPLKQYIDSALTEKDEQSLRVLTVASMNHALDLWNDKLGKSKLDLAEESSLWRVTNDAGTLKTRTLDKYLKIDLLPKNPRYKTVAKTLTYIATQEGMPEEEQAWLLRIANMYQL